MKTVCIYHSNIHIIGGVETSTMNLCKLLNPYYDVTLIFNECQQMNNILNLPCRIKKYQPSEKEFFDIIILESCWGIISLDTIFASKVIQIIHADFSQLGDYAKNNCLPNLYHKSITNYVAVSENVKRTFQQISGLKIDAVIQNLVC
jgi:hypothetical protein